MENIILTFPTKAHEAAAADYLAEHIAQGETMLHGDSGLDSAESYDAWLERIQNDLTLDISSIIFFALRENDSRLVGTINIRYPYEGYVKIHGHIGYGVRPSERQQGYATAMLRLALEKCRELSLSRVLLTCNKNNIASAKTMQACGGVLERETTDENGEISQRYWIDVS